MSEIPIRKNGVIIAYAEVDAETFTEISAFNWSITKNGYAFHQRNYARTYMHRVVMGTPLGMFTDHINGKKLDNRKANLRICTRAENNRNIPRRRRGASGYKGVTWCKLNKKWKAQIGHAGNHYIGLFKSGREAAKAYDREARARHGAFANTNFRRIIKP